MLFEVTTSATASLNLAGELDIGTVGQLESALDPLIAGGGAITVQVSDLDFLDWTGLHAW